MVRLFLLAIIAIPLIEIAVLIRIGQSIGLLATLGLLIGAGLFGALLLRWQGVSVLRSMRQTMGTGKLPGRALADTMLIGIAGVLLILPGLISDLLAILLLLPPIRTLLYAYLARNMVVVSSAGSAPRRGMADEHLIELDDDEYRKR